jgi:hypothetical protein
VAFVSPVWEAGRRGARVGAGRPLAQVQHGQQRRPELAADRREEDLGPILQNSISAENFSDNFPFSYFGHIYVYPNTTNAKLSEHYEKYST